MPTELSLSIDGVLLWRERVGIEPTQDGVTAPHTVLKRGWINFTNRPNRPIARGWLILYLNKVVNSIPESSILGDGDRQMITKYDVIIQISDDSGLKYKTDYLLFHLCLLSDMPL